MKSPCKRGWPLAVLLAAVACDRSEPVAGREPIRLPPVNLPVGDASPLGLVIITVDTLRADYLSCYGHARILTPSIDRISNKGRRLAITRLIAQARAAPLRPMDGIRTRLRTRFVVREAAEFHKLQTLLPAMTKRTSIEPKALPNRADPARIATTEEASLKSSPNSPRTVGAKIHAAMNRGQVRLTSHAVES